jgi:hypothetical protein
MPTYKRSAVTAKEGINFIRSAVEGGGSLFIKIEQENDLGIDALLEFIKDERPLNKQIAVQIKSGASYYTAEATECAFPIGTHRQYWSGHPLPVFGLVYVPSLGTAYWVNLKRYLKANPDATVVRFAATEANKFDAATFTKLFFPAVVGETPVLQIDEAFQLARSKKAAETYLGLLVLFRRYPNNTNVWDELVHTFKTRPAEEIPPVLLYWLAHIPGHGDIFYFGETVSAQTRVYARGLFSQFELRDVIKLLSFIDPEEQIGRGTLGQSIEAIISSLPTASNMLRQIIESSEFEMPVRESAALILAMNEESLALPDLAILEEEGSWYAGEMIKHVKEYGGINPYA